MPFHVIILPFLILTVGLGASSRHYYDAPMPNRCATSDAYDVDNTVFCHAWFHAHYVGPKISAPRELPPQ